MSTEPRSAVGGSASAETGRASRPLDVLALPGSLRRDSYNRRLLAAARRQAPPRMRVRLFDGLARVPLYDEDLDAPGHSRPAGVRRLRAAIASCDGLLISTPEYNQSVPGVLKNAIDWLSVDRRTPVLVGKPVALMGATPGPWGTRLAQRTLRQVLFSTESLVLPGPAIYIRQAGDLFDGPTLAHPETLQRLERFLLAFAEWIDRLSIRPDATAAS